jgi:hypothetical protein
MGALSLGDNRVAFASSDIVHQQEKVLSVPQTLTTSRHFLKHIKRKIAETC